MAHNLLLKNSYDQNKPDRTTFSHGIITIFTTLYIND